MTLAVQPPGTTENSSSPAKFLVDVDPHRVECVVVRTIPIDSRISCQVRYGAVTVILAENLHYASFLTLELFASVIPQGVEEARLQGQFQAIEHFAHPG